MAGPSTPYFPLQVAANLRFTNDNGDLVSQLYPVATSQELDNPRTGYISLIGARLGSTIDTINDIEAVLAEYNTRIAQNETDIADILASGTTAIPSIDGGCLNGNQLQRLDEVTSLMVTDYCSYTSVLGTTSALSAGIAALNTSTLNALPAYSQNSAMAGLAGWISSPTTVGAWMNNLSLAYLDIRVGVTQALNQSNVTCGSIDINISGAYNGTSRIITLYFPGSNIPDNFSDDGSHLLVEDTAGNQYTANFDVMQAVMADGFLQVDISSSTLLQTSNYTVTFTYNVASTTPALGCSNTLITTVSNTTAICPNLSVWSASTTTVSFTFSPTITTNVVYTIDLLDSSGTTVLDTITFTDPSAPVSDTFINLTTLTDYYVRATVTVAGVPTICTPYGITTI